MTSFANCVQPQGKALTWCELRSGEHQKQNRQRPVPTNGERGGARVHRRGARTGDARRHRLSIDAAPLSTSSPVSARGRAHEPRPRRARQRHTVAPTRSCLSCGRSVVVHVSRRKDSTSRGVLQASEVPQGSGSGPGPTLIHCTRGDSGTHFPPAKFRCGATCLTTLRHSRVLMKRAAVLGVDRVCAVLAVRNALESTVLAPQSSRSSSRVPVALPDKV